ncbi:FCD domain-containing protein [Rhizobium sp. TRM96647]|uniref:FCD domain-containing protein n=1 Tax=unclassified Rhizobium TaxID=2613769 RepID=UPI0021E77566|nr:MULTISPECIES: FCD domain-containing protein [unclassified Rhizobium]MCV3736198.1 FCD domain-containing protein [Rhizobium sp. TRM96647]MCV3758140.1 FCD domain-containing protein [Rhizobium sp. TRM96650]
MTTTELYSTPESGAAQSIATGIYRELETMIIEGALAPGDRINEKSFADQRGISRGPIREACRRLEEAGLVEFKVNRGFFVRVLDLRDVLEIYDVRAALFAHAGRILARRITGDQLAELAALHEEMEAAVAAGEADLFYTLNRRFHSRIMAFTKNNHLADIYEGLDRELHIWRKRALILDGNVRASSAEHGLILDVLRNGNPSRIAQVLRDHSLAGRNRLLRTMPEQVARLQMDWDDD